MAARGENSQLMQVNMVVMSHFLHEKKSFVCNYSQICLATSFHSTSILLPSSTRISATTRLDHLVSTPVVLFLQTKVSRQETQPDFGSSEDSQYCSCWLDSMLIDSLERLSFTTSRNCDRVWRSWLNLFAYVGILSMMAQNCFTQGERRQALEVESYFAVKLGLTFSSNELKAILSSGW